MFFSVTSNYVVGPLLSGFDAVKKERLHKIRIIYKEKSGKSIKKIHKRTH
jgi:hypothetical protein